jgi:hypothetical protein
MERQQRDKNAKKRIKNIEIEYIHKSNTNEKVKKEE